VGKAREVAGGIAEVSAETALTPTLSQRERE